MRCGLARSVEFTRQSRSQAELRHRHERKQEGPACEPIGVRSAQCRMIGSIAWALEIDTHVRNGMNDKKFQRNGHCSLPYVRVACLFFLTRSFKPTC